MMITVKSLNSFDDVYDGKERLKLGPHERGNYLPEASIGSLPANWTLSNLCCLLPEVTIWTSPQRLPTREPGAVFSTGYDELWKKE